MPHHKSQHFVPKSYLRNFSSDENGKSINILNINGARLIPSAPIKTQCAKDYFYGKDLVIEKFLQPIEGRYAEVARKLIQADSISDDNLDILKDFCFLQYLRTDIAAQRTLRAQVDMIESLGPIDEKLSVSFKLSEKDVIIMSIRTYLEDADKIADLKSCIFRNSTKIPFITSDDPCVLTNRFYIQRLAGKAGAAGIGNAGAMMIMPLSPRYSIAVYDPGVYTVPDKVNNIVNLTKPADIDALNELQYLKSAYNIYFSDWVSRESVIQSFELTSPQRPDAWHKLHYAIEEGESALDGQRRFRVVHTAEERLSAKSAIVHLEAIMLTPNAWVSKIKFRDRMKFIDTGTGAGYLRKADMI